MLQVNAHSIYIYYVSYIWTGNNLATTCLKSQKESDTSFSPEQ